MPKLLPIGPKPPKQLGPPPPQPPGFEDTIEGWEKRSREHMLSAQRGEERLQQLGTNIERFTARIPGVPGVFEVPLLLQILPKVVRNIAGIGFILPEQTRGEMKREMDTVIIGIERDDFYARLFSQVPIVISGGKFTTVEELLSVLRPPDNITSEELDEIDNIIIGMVETLTDIPQLPELASEAEPVELPELVPPPTLITVPPETIHSLTVSAIIRSITAPVAPPSVMSEEEWINHLIESREISDKADLETVEFLREQAEALIDEWEERNNMLAAYKSGIAEMPDYQLVDLLKEMVVQPGTALLEVAGKYFEHVSAPLAGLVWGAGFGIHDIEAAFWRYKRNEGTWQALGHAWEEWDAPGEGAASWILKYMLMEGLTDPLTYVGWGIATRIAKPLGAVGRWVGFIERGVSDVLELPFDLIKAGVRRLPKTISQQANIASSKAGQYVKKYLTQRYGRAYYQMTMKEWQEGVDAAVKYTLKNPQIDNVTTRAGREFLKHVPVTEKEVLVWADRLGTTLTPEQITKQTIADVDRVFEDFFSKIGGNKKLMTNREAADELVRIMVGNLDNKTSVVAGKILLERSQGIINGARSFGQSKTVAKAGSGLMVRNRRLFLKAESSSVALALKEMGRVSTLLTTVPLRIQKAWVNGIDRVVIRTFAESYLTFAMYGPMNVIEDIIRTLLGGEVPGLRSSQSFARKWVGVSYEPSIVSERSISETMGFLRSADDPNWNNWILQLGGLANGFGRTAFKYAVGVPGQINMAMRRNFLDAKATRILKEIGGEALDTLTHAGPDKLMGVTNKRVVREVQQAAMELKMNGLPEALRATKGDFTRTKIIRREVNDILKEHPDLPRPVRDFIIRQQDDGVLFRDGVNSVDDITRQANDILLNDFIASPERASVQYDQLANLLVDFEVRNPQEMAQLIYGLNFMSSIYGSTPKQILGRAVERTRGLPFADRRASIDKTLDSITLFTERAGASIDRVVEKIRVSMKPPIREVDVATITSRISWEGDIPQPSIDAVADILSTYPKRLSDKIKSVKLASEAQGASINISEGSLWLTSPTRFDSEIAHEIAHTVFPEVRAEVSLKTPIGSMDLDELFAEAFEEVVTGKPMELPGVHIGAQTSRDIDPVVVDEMVDLIISKGWANRGFSIYKDNPAYISKAEQLFNLQTAKRLRASELGEQINSWRHDFFAEVAPADLKTNDFWDDFFRDVGGREHAANVEMADFDGMIKNAIDDLDIAGGLRPRQRPDIKVIDRDLAPQDVAQLIGARGDDISRSMMDVLTSQNDKDMFTSYIMAHIKQGDVGFTKESVGRVYDQIALSLQVDPKNMSWVTGKQMELEAVRRDLHSLHNSKMLPDEEIAAIGKYFDDTASAVEGVMFTPREVRELLSETDIGLGERLASAKETASFRDAVDDLIRGGVSEEQAVARVLGTDVGKDIIVLDPTLLEATRKRVTKLAKETSVPEDLPVEMRFGAPGEKRMSMGDLIEAWFEASDNDVLQGIGRTATTNKEYLAGIQRILREKYPTGIMRIYRGSGKAGPQVLEREFTNITSSRKAAVDFQDTWKVPLDDPRLQDLRSKLKTLQGELSQPNVKVPRQAELDDEIRRLSNEISQLTETIRERIGPDIDNILVRITDVVAIGSVDESELIIRAGVLRNRIENPIKPPIKTIPQKIKPEFTNYNDLRQQAMDEATVWYSKEFTDYSSANAFDSIMKAIYPFWCVPEYATILTRTGWKHHSDLVIGEDVLTVNPDTMVTNWEPVQDIAVFDYDDDLMVIPAKGKDIKFTPNHRWLVVDKLTGEHSHIKRGYQLTDGYDVIPRSLPHEFPKESVLSVRDAAILGWAYTDGYINRGNGRKPHMIIYQSLHKHLLEIEKLVGISGILRERTGYSTENSYDYSIRVQNDDNDRILEICPDKTYLPNLVTRLDRPSAEAMWDAMFKAEGSTHIEYTDMENSCWKQTPGPVMEAFQILSVLLGKAITVNGNRVNLLANHKPYLGKETRRMYKEHYKGKVWCPVTKSGTWFVNCNGSILPTGNTYESQRWFWLPRSFIRHPGTFTSFERWQDNTDYGYIHIPGTSVDVGFGRGTVYGTLQTRLARRDYPEYYDSLGAAGDVIEFSDFLSRYGFYPGAHIGVPLALFGGVEMQFGEAVPSLVKTPLDILIALFPDNESVRWISDRLFGDRFRKYMEILQINRRGGDGTLIFSKQQEGVDLTEEEEQLLTDARREVGWYSAGFEQFGVFRMRTGEQHKMYEEASKVIEEMTGFTIDQQDWLRQHGYRIWDMVGGMSPSEQAILKEMDYYRWVGNIRPLLPGRQQEILNKIELAWDSVNRFTEQLQDSKLILQREFLSAQRGPDDYNSLLLDIYDAQRKFIDNKVEEFPLMDLDNRAEYYREFNQPQPVLHPMRELMNLYFSIELLEMTEPETGEKRRDWDNFWAQRQAIEEAIPDDFKQEWDDFLSKNSTRMEQVRRDVGRTYFRTYNKVWETILSTYNDEEQGLIEEYLFLERTGQKLDRQAGIKATTSEKTGNLLISSFRTEVSGAKKALRFANPHLDAWLFYWGRTSAFTAPGAEEVYKQIARETGRKI
ncbi:hypothetical protein LCGC14_0383080 [marine sediment metagenome]|uniref:DOD-type homing endonuclease domain-containing protein n=1 Tax=marine sediment metagenome TaxID=412755 RepID=A0A0F9T7I0_9ZZZZ